MNRRSLPRAALIASTLMLVSWTVQAQTPATPAAPTAPAAPESSTSYFDGYRALTVTVGVLGGAVVGSLLASNVILPIYCWMAGGTAATSAGAATVGAGMGARAGAAGGGAMAGMGAGGWAFHNAMATLGAVSGGFYADAVYQRQ